MNLRWLALLLVVILIPHQSSFSQTNPHDFTKKPAPLQAKCVTFFNSAGKDRNTRHEFISTPKSVLIRELSLLRSKLHRGTVSYSSVAFVLAYRGISVTDNVRRILDTWEIPHDTKQVHLDAEGCDDSVHRQLLVVYDRNPNADIIRLIIHSSSDGGAAEDRRATIVDMFLRNPVQTMEAAMSLRTLSQPSWNRGDGVSALTKSLVEAGGSPWIGGHPDYTLARRKLRQLRRSPNPKIATASRRCSHEFEGMVAQLYHKSTASK